VGGDIDIMWMDKRVNHNENDDDEWWLVKDDDRVGL
jgi:hypothetical protein